MDNEDPIRKPGSKNLMIETELTQALLPLGVIEVKSIKEDRNGLVLLV